MVAGLVVPKSLFFRSGDNRAVAKGQGLLFSRPPVSLRPNTARMRIARRKYLQAG